MKKAVKLFLAVMMVLLCAASAFASVDRVRHTIFDDFETGECFGWEPYPYQQDIGYDPLYFTRRSPTYKGSRYSLARPVRAQQAVELYHGFTKRINMFTTADSRMRVAIFLQGDRDGTKLELSLGLFDGRRFFHTINNPKGNEWLELDIPASNFVDRDGNALGVGEHVQVVTIRNEYEIVYYLYTYTIYMDDFSFSGERQRRFVAVEPTSVNFDMFDTSILEKHFFWGDTISLAVTPERGTPVSSVTGTLLDSNGRTVASNIRFTNDGGVWRNNSIHRLTEKDARGQWEIRLTGAAGQNTVDWAIKFLVPGDRQLTQTHPRLLFSKDELAARQEAGESPVARKILENALNDRTWERSIEGIEEANITTDEVWTTHPFSKGFNFASWRAPMTALGQVAMSGGMRYAFTGDREAGEKAKEALLKLCSFNEWNCPWMIANKFWTYFPVGYVVRHVAYAYDTIHDLMTESERKFVRDALMQKALIPFHRDMVEMNRMPSNQTNHIAVLVTGMGLAAITIYGEEPDNPQFEPYLSGILEKTKTFIERTYYPDGSYAEPYNYQSMATREIVEVIYALERNFGIDLTTTTDIKDFYWYALYATDNQRRMNDFGDTGYAYHGTYGFTQLSYLWLAYRLHDPWAYNFVKPHYDGGGGGIFGYLWYVDGIESKSREILPSSRMFDGKGTIIMRSNWEDDSAIITFKAGPNANHYHYDQGHFVIRMNDENLLHDPHIGPGYYQPYFVMYNSHSVAHNVLLLDMDPESQMPAHYDNGIAALRDWPRMIHSFTGEIADAAEGDLACVYKDKLSNYTRTLLYTKDGALFLFDRVSSYQPHQFNWLFHAAPEAMAFNNGRLTIDKEKARMTMDVVAIDMASDGSVEQYSPPNTLRVNVPPHQQDDSYVAIPSKQGAREAIFLAVINPEARPVNGDFGERPVTTRLDSRGWIGARTQRGNVQDMAMFRLNNSASNSVEGFETDASRFTARFEGGRLSKAYFEGSSFSGNGVNISASAPSTIALAPNGSGLDVEIKASGRTQLSITTGRPSSVAVNGATSRDWRYDARAGVLNINVPEGRTDLVLR